jgi:regulator of chromosome condensation
MVKFPRLVKQMAGKRVVRVTCGGMHNAAITNTGELYTWGCNDDKALGRAGDENFPARVTEGFAPGEVITQAACGDCHTAVATLSGKVYEWGCYKDTFGKRWMTAAPGDAKAESLRMQELPQLVAGLEGVVELKGGESFNAVVTSTGKCFTWGIAETGQLGREVCALKDDDGMYEQGDVLKTHLTPQSPMLHGRPLEDVKVVGCGSYQVLIALADGGRVYAAGLNNYGQLGLGHVDAQKGLGEIVGLADKQIVALEGGLQHSMALGYDGTVYAFGRGDSGQVRGSGRRGRRGGGGGGGGARAHGLG